MQFCIFVLIVNDFLLFRDTLTGVWLTEAVGGLRLFSIHFHFLQWRSFGFFGGFFDTETSFKLRFVANRVVIFWEELLRIIYHLISNLLRELTLKPFNTLYLDLGRRCLCGDRWNSIFRDFLGFKCCLNISLSCLLGARFSFWLTFLIPQPRLILFKLNLRRFILLEQHWDVLRIVQITC